MSVDLKPYEDRLWQSIGLLPDENWRILKVEERVVEQYMLSDHGRIVSLPRKRVTRHGDVSVWPGKLIQQHKASVGSHSARVNISVDGTYRLFSIDDLLVWTFGAQVTTRQLVSTELSSDVSYLPQYAAENMGNRVDAIMVALSNTSANLIPAYLQRFDREQTRRAYRNDLHRFFGTGVVNRDLASQVTFLHVNEHIRQLEDAGSKATSIKRRIAALRGFFDWLEALELISRNPTKKELLRKVRSVRSKDRALLVLSARQAEILLAATEEAGPAAIRDYALLLTLLHCVLRRSEAAAMDVAHIRPIGHYWIIDLPNTKGGADQYVKLPAVVAEAIEHHRQHYGIASGPLWRSMSNNNKNKRLSATAIYNIVRRTAERAELSEKIGAHTLRHTGCTLAIEGGASLQQVQTHARHKNIETTLVYVHQRDKLRDSAADFIRIKPNLQ